MSFTEAWLAGEPRARALLPKDPWRPEHRSLALEEAGSRSMPPAVRSMLARQVPAWRDEDAVAVVTGQQAGLFLGPLYTLYKACHAVAAARSLSASGGRRVLPVFWVASEDHDLPEASSCHVAGETGGNPGERAPGTGDAPGTGAGAPGTGEEPDGGLVKLELSPPDSASIPLASRRLGPEVVALLDHLETLIADLPRGAEVLSLLRRHYRAEASFPEAFTGTLRELFEGTELAIVDPRDPAMLEASLPLHRLAFERCAEISAALLERSRLLEAAGYGAPVHVRPGAPLSFVHPDGEAGERFRVEPDGDGWSLVGSDRRLSREELGRWLEAEPARFSSSALLRPILQDLLLPTAALVGGPGELAYLAQTPPLYQAFARPMPMLLPRARWRIVGARERRAGERLGLALDELGRPWTELLNLVGGRRAGDVGEALRIRVLRSFDEGAKALAEAGEELDPGVAKALSRTRAALDRQVGRLVDRHRRSLAERDRVRIGRLAGLRASLAPGGVPQERVHGFPEFAARVGPRELRDRLLSRCELLPTACLDLAT